MDLKPELVAIVSEGIVYIINQFFFNIYDYKGKEEITLPENTVRFNTIVSKKNEYLKDIAFPKFYNRLETVDINGQIDDCEWKAREIQLSKNPVIKSKPFENLFSGRDVAEILCGLINMEEEINKRFEREREKWIYEKSFNCKVEELIESKTGVEDWEAAIAEGLGSVDAKTVTVEFELNNKKASAKISPDKIRRIMIEDDYFSGFNFATTKSGDELIDYLGADTWRGDNRVVLTCKHISKITYGKKELYVRS